MNLQLDVYKRQMVSSLGADLTLALIGLSGFVPLGLGILYKRLD